MLRLYLNPEQPPGSTPTRRPAVSGATCSSAMNFRTSAAALSVTVSVMGVAFCVVAMMYPPITQEVSQAEPECQPPACIPGRRSPNWGAPITESYPHAARLPRLRSEEHTSELQSLRHLVCRLLLEKKKTNRT